MSRSSPDSREPSPPGTSPVAWLGARPVEARRFLATARFLDLFRPVLDHVAERIAVLEATRQSPGPPTTQELQAEADAYRRVLGLHRAKDFLAWLESVDLTLDEFEEEMELRVQRRKKRESFAPREVEAAFREARADFDRARISQLVVASEGLARELALAAAEGEGPGKGEAFAKLARQHSLDEATREHGGLVGWVRRRDLGPDLAAPVFGTQPGRCAGPVRLAPDTFQVVLVHETRPATLDAATEDEVRDALLARWTQGLVAALGPVRP